MQIPILSGITTDENADFRTAYPKNMIPVPKDQGISNGYLRPSDGIEQLGTGPGVDRGSINWNGVNYRVMGTKLVSVDSSGATTELGDVGGSGQVTMDYSFDLLAIASSGNFFYWDGATLSQVTDPDLGTVIDFIWVDGYFMTTDGENLVVTELDDPFSVNPIKYGSSEADPDPILGLVKVRNEPVALNRHTIETFDNIGGNFFPFQRIDGAQIKKGTIGTFSCAVYNEGVAFLGSGRGNNNNEAPGVYWGANGSTQKISTREIDQLLKTYTEQQLSKVVFEVNIEDNFNQLIMRLPDRQAVFGSHSSAAVGDSVWSYLSGGIKGFSKYPAVNRTWCYDKWMVGDDESDRIGTLVKSTSHQWGEKIGWQFGTKIAYNDSKGYIVNELELVALTGRVAVGTNPRIYTEYSEDGEIYSNPRFIRAGKTGNRKKRLAWRNQGRTRNWRVQRFTGDSDAHISFARLEAELEPLAW